MRFWLTIIFVLIIDQFTKFLVISRMAVGESRPVINGIFNLTYVHNQGAAFGIMQGKSMLFLTMAILVVIVIIIYNYQNSPVVPVQYFLGLIVGGSLGNVIDRWYYGSVIDFLSIGWWPVFNMADSAIVCGGILLMIYVLKYDRCEQTQ